MDKFNQAFSRDTPDSAVAVTLMKFETGTIPQILTRLREEGIYISENALRTWVKAGSIPASYCGKRAYLWYPNVLAFLREGNTLVVTPSKTVNGIRRIG